MTDISCRECGVSLPNILYWRFNPCSNGGEHRLQPIEVQALHLRNLAQSDQESAANEEGEWLL
jgi:hypothetical protein